MVQKLNDCPSCLSIDCLWGTCVTICHCLIECLRDVIAISLHQTHNQHIMFPYISASMEKAVKLILTVHQLTRYFRKVSQKLGLTLHCCGKFCDHQTDLVYNCVSQ